MTLSRFYAHQDPPMRPIIERALRSGNIAKATLLMFDFVGSVARLCDRTVPIVDGDTGQTWQPLLKYIQIEDVSGGPGELAPLRTYSLFIPRAWAARFGGSVGPIPQTDEKHLYQGREAALLEQLITPAGGPNGEDMPLGRPYYLHRGRMDKVERAMTLDGVTHSMRVEGITARGGVPSSGVLTPRNQKSRHPTDLGADYIPEIPLRDIIWPKHT